MSRAARALIVAHARQFHFAGAAFGMADGRPVIHAVSRHFQRIAATHRASECRPAGLCVLPVASDKNDRVRTKRDEVFLRHKIGPLVADGACGFAVPDEHARPGDGFIIRADGQFRARDLEDMKRKLQRRRARSGRQIRGYNNGACGTSIYCQRGKPVRRHSPHAKT